MFAFFESPQRVQKLASHLVICAMAMLVIGSLLAYSLSAHISITCRVLGPPGSGDRSGANFYQNQLHVTPANAKAPQDAQANCSVSNPLYRVRATSQVSPGGPKALHAGGPFFN